MQDFVSQAPEVLLVPTFPNSFELFTELKDKPVEVCDFRAAP